MNDKERLELTNLRNRVRAQREEIKRLQRRGTWDERIVEDENDKYGLFRRRFYCSACGDWTTHGKSAYCPHCGARMDRGEDN